MGFSAKIIQDNISEAGNRLTTMEVCFPRIVLAEFNTHRMFSRNSASSRAIPIEKQIKRIQEDPFIPEKFPVNAKGMQPQQYHEPWVEGKGVNDGADYRHCEFNWLLARDKMIETVNKLVKVNVHKQIANRLLEPWMWHTVIVTATEWDNFFKLRCDVNAQFEIYKIACMMRDEYYNSKPVERYYGYWHTPYILEDEMFLPDKDRCKISVARCARVSYLTHDGVRDTDKDLELYSRLLTSGHLSPFEHVAMAMASSGPSGNFYGWSQYRKNIERDLL